MSRDTHITSDEMIAYTAGEMDGQTVRDMDAHLETCGECATRVAGLQAFVEDLDTSWNRERLRAMGVGHPSPSDLEALWMSEAGEAGEASTDLIAVQAHIQECADCTAYLRRLEQGFAALQQADPLGQPAWSSRVRRRFAAGIEVVVEAASGAFTTASGMVREVMTPQHHVQLAPAQAIAMGGNNKQPSGVLWSDATFQTDELSGEITGSTDNSTGRGILTVVINKSGDYVATPPIVDLINTQGQAVATQSALDMGDRYSAVFSNLDQGEYLVGIREPGE